MTWSSEAGLRQVICTVRERQLRIYEHVARFPAEDSANWILFLSRFEWLDHAEGPIVCFMVASRGDLSEGHSKQVDSTGPFLRMRGQ